MYFLVCSEQSMFGKANYMSPLDVQQYLYCLTPRAEVCANPRLLKGITNIGKLDIVWKKNMGERGRLQTSALQRVVCVIIIIIIITGVFMLHREGQ